MAALVWWAYFPVPLFPEGLMILFAPVAKFIASNQLPELMDVWALLGIMSYIVCGIFVGFVGLKIVGRG